MAKSATRTLEILEAVSMSESGMSHADIARDLQIPKSSMTDLLRDLTRAGYLEYDEREGRFWLGAQTLALSNAFLRRFDPIKRGQNAVRRLRARIHETIHLSILQGDDVLVIHQETGPHLLSAVLRVGDRAPALSTAAGRAIIAFLDADTQNAMFERAIADGHRKSLPSRDAWTEEMAAIAAGGVAFVDQTWVEGVAAFGIPVFGTPVFGAVGSRPVAAISVVLPVSRLDDAARRAIERALAEETRRDSAIREVA